MRLLLDTHVLLWSRFDERRLTRAQGAAIRDPRNTIFVSSVSLAEMSIKVGLNKLTVPDGLVSGLGEWGANSLPFTAAHAAPLLTMPQHHRDPFDRMLISQAIVDDLVFVTADERCRAYDVRTL
ncbi:MAG: type II toxin-antitoxin system VapC family toxin [Pseudolysinimonas sp.]